MTTITIVCLSLLGLTGAFTAGTWFGKSRAVNREVNNFTHLLEERDSWIIASDKYKVIAESRDVKLPEQAKLPKFKWEPYDSFQYDNHIQYNLDAIRRDFAKFDDGRYRVSIEVFVIGQWAQWLKGKRSVYSGDADIYTEAPSWDFNTPAEYDAFGRLSTSFQGEPKDVVDEIERHLKNPYWGLWCGGVKRNDDGGKEWGYARPKVSIRFILKVEKRAILTPKPDPNIVYVEVAVQEPTYDLRIEAEREVDSFLSKHPRLLIQGAK
jgi:hypothetical protein